VSYIIKTRDDFLLDGVSALTYGLAVEMPQPVPMARQRYTTFQSGDSDTTTPDDSFDAVRYTLTARRIKTPDTFRASDLYAALASAKTLTLTRNAGRVYRIASVVDVTPTARINGNEITYRITFNLQPFAYYADNPIVTPENSSITNPGTRYSRPIYYIQQAQTGGGSLITNASISVNGQTLAVSFPPSSGGKQTIVVDAERMIAYNNADGTNWTRYTSGLFPFLSPGSNAIAATDCTVTLRGNWRDY
jgi:phage-related protein